FGSQSPGTIGFVGPARRDIPGRSGAGIQKASQMAGQRGPGLFQGRATLRQVVARAGGAAGIYPPPPGGEYSSGSFLGKMVGEQQSLPPQSGIDGIFPDRSFPPAGLSIGNGDDPKDLEDRLGSRIPGQVRFVGKRSHPLLGKSSRPGRKRILRSGIKSSQSDQTNYPYER